MILKTRRKNTCYPRYTIIAARDEEDDMLTRGEMKPKIKTKRTEYKIQNFVDGNRNTR